MKPIHKLNGGIGATLCHSCTVIISTGLTQDIFCKPCLETKELCDCGNVATWDYMPGYGDGSNSVSCDECVPRGCYCNHKYLSEEYDNKPPSEYEEGVDYKWIEKDVSWCEIDEEGREYPCCEYMYERRGWNIEDPI